MVSPWCGSVVLYGWVLGVEHIDKAEFVAAFGLDNGAEFDIVDTDNGGELSKEEYMSAYGKGGRLA